MATAHEDRGRACGHGVDLVARRPSSKQSNLKRELNTVTSPDAYSAAQGAHAIAIATEWDEFKTLDYKKIYDSMAKPAFVFDGRNIVDAAALREIGFTVYSIGKPVGLK